MSDLAQTSQALPGFEEMLPTSGVHDSRRRTVINLFYSNRGKYDEIVKSLSRGEDVKSISLRLSIAPVALRDFLDLVIEGSVCDGIAKSATAAAIFYKNRYKLMARKAHSRVLNELLSRDLSEMTVSELLAMSKHFGSVSDVDVSNGESKKQLDDKSDVIDYDALINGLDEEKIRAPELAGDLGADDEAERALKCSTRNSSTGDRSFKMCDTMPKSPINSGALCNGLCKLPEVGADGSDSPARAPAASASAEGPQGAGGTPGASRAGGVN